MTTTARLGRPARLTGLATALAVPGPAAAVAGAPWEAAVAVAVCAMCLNVLAPRWTSREARAVHLARGLRDCGFAPDQIAPAVNAALVRRAGQEELDR